MNKSTKENNAATLKPVIKSFFEPVTSTISHIVTDPNSKCCAIVDPVLDYDPNAGRTGTFSADRLVAYVSKENLTVEWILETHAHADHLSAAPYLKMRLGGRTGIGEHIVEVQKVFGKLFNLEKEFRTDGGQFDRLFTDGEIFFIGQLAARIMYTPGHTPACITYLVGDVAFVGDTLFMPDYGTARCDFPGGDARQLYQSIHRLLGLPAKTRLYTCHDYKPNGRDAMWETTVEEQARLNIHVHRGVSEQAFVRMRTERDSTLAMPNLLLPSVQVNIRAGKLPPADDNGIQYLKIPLNAI